MILRIVPFNVPSLGYPKVDIEIPEAFETAEFDPGTLSASPLIDMYRRYYLVQQ